MAVLGLGPIGDMAARIADHLGYRVIAVDLVPERLARAASVASTPSIWDISIRRLATQSGT